MPYNPTIKLFLAIIIIIIIIIINVLVFFTAT